MNRKTAAPPTERWIRRMADAEDGCASIAVGGLAYDLGMLTPGNHENAPWVFARLLTLARRRREMTIDALAKEADVDVAELLALENGDVTPTPRTVYQLAQVLGVSTSKLLAVAGLADVEDESLKEATLRFAARSEPTTKLSKPERDALEEFVKVLVEKSDGG